MKQPVRRKVYRRVDEYWSLFGGKDGEEICFWRPKKAELYAYDMSRSCPLEAALFGVGYDEI